MSKLKFKKTWHNIYVNTYGVNIYANSDGTLWQLGATEQGMSDKSSVMTSVMTEDEIDRIIDQYENVSEAEAVFTLHNKIVNNDL